MSFFGTIDRRSLAVLASLMLMFDLIPAHSAASEPDIAKGQKLYAQHCASCHGANLEGQPNWRDPLPDGRLRAPPHDETGHTWHHSDEQLFEITKRGPAAIVGGTYRSDMQGYQGILSDSEIRAVLAYIKNSWPDRIRKRHDARNKRRDE